jgi:hypothetical protein
LKNKRDYIKIQNAKIALTAIKGKQPPIHNILLELLWSWRTFAFQEFISFHKLLREAKSRLYTSSMSLSLRENRYLYVEGHKTVVMK